MRYKHVFFFVSDVAFVQYDKFDNILDYFETQVPQAFQRKGIAQILAKVNGDFSIRIRLFSIPEIHKWIQNLSL